MDILNVLTRLAVAVQKRKEAHSRLYHLFLTQDIAQHDTGKGYRALARLICKGYFTTILTSNMNTALETALEEEGLHPSLYKVFVIEQDSNEQILDALEGQQSCIHIVKLPYDRSQTAQNSLPLTLSSDIQISLQHYFNRNIIILGCMDQEEDARSALNSHGKGGIYYVRQNLPLPNDIVVQCIDKQKKQIENFLISGTYGEFNTFFSTLEALINDGTDRNQTSPASHHTVIDTRYVPSSHNQIDKQPQPPALNENIDSQPGPQQTKRSPESPKRKRPTVFISYSHRDDMHLDRLLVHLKPLESKGLIDVVWSDKRIESGAEWEKEIRQAIASARIAILLISADFLASDFITGVELPALLEISNKEGIVILPVIAGFCNYDYYTELTRFQSVNAPSKPLSKKDSDENEKIWGLVVQRIRKLVDSDNL